MLCCLGMLNELENLTMIWLAVDMSVILSPRVETHAEELFLHLDALRGNKA